MNKNLFIFSLLWCAALSSGAQILVGPTVGPNFSWVSFDDDDVGDEYTVSPVAGFHAGVMVSFRVQKRFYLNTSLIYSTKGRILKRDDDPLFRNEVSYRYLEMPILYTAEFTGSLGGNRQYKWYFGAGPNVSYWLGGKGTFTSSELSEKNIDELPYKIAFDKDPIEVGPEEMGIEDPNRIQLGLTIAAGFAFEPVGYERIMVLFRYELGHSFLSRTSNGIYQPVIYEEPLKVRNQGFRISLSYLIDTKVEQRKKGKSTIKRSRR